LSYFCFGYVAWIFFSWFYIYLAQVRGLNLKASAFYAMLPAIAMAVFCILVENSAMDLLACMGRAWAVVFWLRLPC